MHNRRYEDFLIVAQALAIPIIVISISTLVDIEMGKNAPIVRESVKQESAEDPIMVSIGRGILEYLKREKEKIPEEIELPSDAHDFGRRLSYVCKPYPGVVIIERNGNFTYLCVPSISHRFSV